jgi:hypothetical protein
MVGKIEREKDSGKGTERDRDESQHQFSFRFPMGGNFRHRLVRYYWKKTPTIVKNAKSHHENSSGTSSRTPIPLGWWFRVQHPGSLRSASFTHEIGKYHAYRVYHPTWLWLNMNGDVLIFLVIYLDKEHFLNRVYDKQMADGFYFFSSSPVLTPRGCITFSLHVFPHMKLIM